jgi:hypothetical protein
MSLISNDSRELVEYILEALSPDNFKGSNWAVFTPLYSTSSQPVEPPGESFGREYMGELASDTPMMGGIRLEILPHPREGCDFEEVYWPLEWAKPRGIAKLLAEVYRQSGYGVTVKSAVLPRRQIS